MIGRTISHRVWLVRQALRGYAHMHAHAVAGQMTNVVKQTSAAY